MIAEAQTLAVHAAKKAMSVRVFATVVALGLWGYLAVDGQLPSEFSAGLITLIINWYFKREGAGEE